ncbi:Divalent Anion:Na+ Symporter [Paratrimastix pyriformis]|uniref:Divalent Anion:Na+ Symporter n=1 Tax=Paratrimastix pyriformis TaxID=342808 RepID=A0ABQ8UIZ8_9EUKA|nr:Divalent Anion:Na+ Symporter [Paratrimastix pyriformis]
MPPQEKKPLNRKQWATIGIFLGTIVLWFIVPWIRQYLGNEGIVSIIPLVLIFGLNLVPRSELKSLPWHIVLLVMGGSALGKAVENSKLLLIFTDLMGDFLEESSTWLVLVVFDLFISLVACFVSHTVSALVLLPLVAAVAGDHVVILVLGGALACCGPMPLPVSSFPNVCTISVEGPDGRPYLSTMDFLKMGSLITLVAVLSVPTLYYATALLFL